MRKLYQLLFILFCLQLSTPFIMAQSKAPKASDAQQRLNDFTKRQQLNEQTITGGIDFKSVGPSVMSGRVVNVAVNPKDPTHFYVAYASGGLWETRNNGNSFTSIFDQQAVMTIGDIAVHFEDTTAIIWVGSGENNSSRSSYAGTGMYKSNDGGKTWQHKGLVDSHHIGRIALDPTDKNVVHVAVLGHLYSPNKERGIYKSTDGGDTWKKTLFVNDNAGAIDLIIDPNDSKILYAATWERTRRAWHFKGSGSGSGLYKSTDNGNNWTLLNTEKSGFPTGKGVGRIGINMHSDGTLYAVLDNQNRRPAEDKYEKEVQKLTKDDLRQLSKTDFLALDETKLANFLKDNRFPKKYDVSTINSMIKNDKIVANDLVVYLEDANALLFDTPVIGAEVYRSKDGGISWQKTHDDFIDDLVYSYGYYFGQIRVLPQNSDQIYILGVPLLCSTDGGKTFKAINDDNVHADHHALWCNPNKQGHLINGNDGGINISYDNGDNWMKCNNPAVGQFYTVAVDNEKPYNIYGGLQDNGVWVGPSTYTASNKWHQDGEYPYKSVMGGDGMQIAIDERNSNIIYTGYQFGNYYRINRKSNKYTYISPKHELGEHPLRFNWQTPIHLSIHHQDILYMGSHKLHRSLHQGDTWENISDDLTQGGKKGNVAYGTLSSIHESPLKFGLLYTGSDDGLVHVSRDGGYSWTNISKGLPKNLWVSRVQASAHKEGTVYVSLNGYRWDDFSAYLYVSNNYGKTWTKIGTNLPAEPINVVKEDPSNDKVLYVGSDHSLYVSFDKGGTFMGMNGQLPDAPVHDLVVQNEAKELVIGTHGRSIYIANIAHLQALNDEILAKNLHLFSVAAQKHSSRWGNSWSKWQEPNTPEIDIPIYSKNAQTIEVVIMADSTTVLKTLSYEAIKGINYISYDLSLDEAQKVAYENYLNKQNEDEEDVTEISLKAGDNGLFYLKAGTYTIKIQEETVDLVVE